MIIEEVQQSDSIYCLPPLNCIVCFQKPCLYFAYKYMFGNQNGIVYIADIQALCTRAKYIMY